MPWHREKCSNRYSGDGPRLQHNTPRAVRCLGTGKNVRTATAAAPVCRRATLGLRLLYQESSRALGQIRLEQSILHDIREYLVVCHDWLDLEGGAP